MGLPETFFASSFPALPKGFLRHRAPPFRLVQLTPGRAVLFHAAPALEHHADPLSGFPRQLEGEPTVERPVKFSRRPGLDTLHRFASSFWIKVFASLGG